MSDEAISITPTSLPWSGASRAACVRCSYSPTVIAAAITSQTNKAKLPTHIALSAPDHGLPRDSVVLLEQVRTLDKRRLRERMGRVDGELMERIDAAIAVSFGLGNTQLI